MTQDSSFFYVGIDAHKDALAVAVLPEHADDPEAVRTLPNDPTAIRRFFRRLRQRGDASATYEAGCLGFVLYRQLTKLGIDCVVAAPGLIPVRPGDRRKTDRLDAIKLARDLRARELTPVRVPTVETEALRALTRTRDAMRKDVVRMRHRILKFTLLRGKAFREGQNWTDAHLRWLRQLDLGLDEDRRTLDFLLDELQHRCHSKDLLDERIRRRGQEEDLRQDVRALRAYRGVGDLTAVSVIAEIGDPRRFRHANQVASYCGLIPSERSSGQQIRKGGITHAGNAYLRRLLVECSQHYGRPYGSGRALAARRAEAPGRAVAWARKAEKRLKARFRSLAARKHRNVAKTAIARELAGFLWATLHPHMQP